MGNVLAQPKVLQPEPVSDLPSVVLKDTLGEYTYKEPWKPLHSEFACPNARMNASMPVQDGAGF